MYTLSNKITAPMAVAQVPQIHHYRSYLKRLCLSSPSTGKAFVACSHLAHCSAIKGMDLKNINMKWTKRVKTYDSSSVSKRVS